MSKEVNTPTYTQLFIQKNVVENIFAFLYRFDNPQVCSLEAPEAAARPTEHE